MLLMLVIKPLEAVEMLLVKLRARFEGGFVRLDNEGICSGFASFRAIFPLLFVDYGWLPWTLLDFDSSHSRELMIFLLLLLRKILQLLNLLR